MVGRQANEYPMLAPHGWASDFPTFREAPPPYVRSSLLAFLPDASPEQLAAWDESIAPLQREVGEVLGSVAGATSYGTILEYQLPLNHRRPDVLLLMGGSVLVVEAKGKDRASQADIDQVAAYARDLAAYHELCEFQPVHAVLMLTRARGRIGEQAGVHVIGPDALDELATELNGSPESLPINTEAFLAVERYRPSPSLVRAARELFETGSLVRIKRAAAVTEPAIKILDGVAHEAARTQRRSLVLVTGSPGTGKTLVGLQFVHSAFLDDLAVERGGRKPASPAVFLSGNGPLVEVLQYELRSAGGGGRTFVRDVRSYVERYLGNQSLVPNEHVVVFDEAQRAWDADMVAREHRVPGSEPEHFIKFAERIPEWSIVVALIGSGQEIHAGEEAGLSQWRWALEAAHDPDSWTVVVPPDAADAFEGLRGVRLEPALRLDTELRYHSASAVHAFVDRLLAHPGGTSPPSGRSLDLSRYHLRITRDLETAKRYLRDRYADNPDARFGLIASSRDRELPRFGVLNDWNSTKNVRKGPWFCEGDAEPLGRSCRSMVDTLTEFGCQGLELDCALVAWGTDLVLEGGSWTDRLARRYQRPSEIRDAFGLRRNAYRVLLTRGRDGTVVFVPSIPILDETYWYLVASGFRELGVAGATALGADAQQPDLSSGEGDLERLIGAARLAGALERIEYRDPIAAYGVAALQPLVELATVPGLGGFAIRTIARIGEVFPRASVDALRSIESSKLSASVIEDLDSAITHIAPRRPLRTKVEPRRAALGAPTTSTPTRLEAGKPYRRRALHAAFLGGNQQKGISYPARGDHVLLFSGGTGNSQYGYDDFAIGGDRYSYFGEYNGPGDMTMTYGNQRIVERSPRLYLFIEKFSGIYEFAGQFEYESHAIERAARDGREVNAIVFTLHKVADVVEL